MKQRLVGAIVLGCLAIIFIPILLDGEGLSSPEITNNIPSPPPLPEIPQNVPVRPVIVADSLPDESTATSAPPAAESPVAETEEPAVGDVNSQATDLAQSDQPSLDVRGLPASWSVRLASFGDRANADALVTRLLADGHKAYVRPVNSSQGNLTGVFVGPVITRADADNLLSDLSEAYDLDGIVVQFTIDPLE